LFEMRHVPSGVRVFGNQPCDLLKFNLWGVNTTICPEPFQEIRLPRDGRNVYIWNIWYDFRHEPPKK
jgi:hypothetical protein